MRAASGPSIWSMMNGVKLSDVMRADPALDLAVVDFAEGSLGGNMMPMFSKAPATIGVEIDLHKSGHILDTLFPVVLNDTPRIVAFSASPRAAVSRT